MCKTVTRFCHKRFSWPSLITVCIVSTNFHAFDKNISCSLRVMKSVYLNNSTGQNDARQTLATVLHTCGWKILK